MDENRIRQAEVISIGDELTSGQRLDTNSQWLSQQLGELGIQTTRHTTVGDDLANNIDAIGLAASRVDFVIVTGGLGPTLDDLTRQAIAEAFGCPLELHLESLQKIQHMFARRNREMPERNRTQALFPRGSLVIPNPHGSAPGIDLQVHQGVRSCRIIALPGVPAEMKQMWFESVVPRLEHALGMQQGRLRYHAIKLFGIGESDVEVKLPDLIDRQRVPTVGITVSRATITLRIAARAKDDAHFASLIEPTIQEIYSAVGELIFGQGEDELEHAVLRQLKESSRSLATLEVGAASWVCDWILRITDPADSCFRGGISFPNETDAAQWLSTPAQGSPDFWANLARQTKTRFQSDIGLAVGIYPTPQAMEDSQSAFLFHFAIALGDDVVSIDKEMGGHPDVLGPRVAKTALDLLRRQLSQKSLT